MIVKVENGNLIVKDFKLVLDFKTYEILKVFLGYLDDESLAIQRNYFKLPSPAYLFELYDSIFRLGKKVHNKSEVKINLTSSFASFLHFICWSDSQTLETVQFLLDFKELTQFEAYDILKALNYLDDEMSKVLREV